MPDEIQLITLDEVHRITSLSPSTILRLRKLGEFPAPVMLSTKNMYVRSEVIAWARGRANARTIARGKPGEVQRIVRVGVDGSVRHSLR
jgi:predicted DNA-binding transcriptional regulator AlpA